jgi:glycosyltransferase involved in cell wall biosynthesis
MRGEVLLNALFLDPGISGGSETYLHHLVPALFALDTGTSFAVATTRRGAASLQGEDWAGELEVIALPCDDDEPVRRTLAEHVLLPRLARRRTCAVLHSLSNRGPRRSPVASVVTVHDVIFFQHPAMGFVSTQGMRWAVRAAVSGADGVIAVSEEAAAEIARTLGIDRGRITVVPHGPGRDPRAVSPPEVARARAAYGLAGARVVLCVAAKRPHKNQRLLVDALPHLPPDVRLLLVGRDEGYGAELRTAASERGVSERVVLLEDVSDAELEALWAMTACAAFPAVAEGFGLPVLEAMRRGVPVACSDIAVLREVGGDAARYFDPNDARSAGAANAAALSDGGAAERGRARAAEFSWERAAERTFEVYERAMARRSGT